MSSERERCPSADAVTRAHGADADPAVVRHVAACATCGPAWKQDEALRRLAVGLVPAPITAERRQAIRARLIAHALVSEPITVAAAWRPQRWLAAAAILTAVGVGAALWVDAGAGSGESLPAAPAAPALIHRGRVHAQAGARFALVGAQPDEIVRLDSGRLTVEVAHLMPGERFRVVTADGEVEVRGTAFDVVASDDKLISVRVLHGVVVVRAEGRQPAVLTASQRWSAKKPVPRARSTALPASVMSTMSSAARPGSPTQDVADVQSAAATPNLTPIVVHRRRARRAADTPRSGHRAVSAALKPPVTKSVATNRPVIESDAERRYRRGWQALRAGHNDAAAVAFAAVAHHERNNALAEDATFWQATALERARHAARAIAALQTFVHQFPSSSRYADAATMLGWLLLKSGDRAGAKRWFSIGAQSGVKATSEGARRGLLAIESTRQP